MNLQQELYNLFVEELDEEHASFLSLTLASMPTSQALALVEAVIVEREVQAIFDKAAKDLGCPPVEGEDE